MPTINAGASATVALPAGQTMAFNFGAGTAQVVPPEPASVAPPVVNVTTGSAVGPFDQAVSVFVRALQFTDYEIRTPSDVLDRSGRVVGASVVMSTFADLQTLAAGSGLIPGATYVVGLARYQALTASTFATIGGSVLYSSAVPIIVLSSGTFANTTGSMTGLATLPVVPVGVVRVWVWAGAGIPASGLYFATFSSGSACQLWLDAAGTITPTGITAGPYAGGTSEALIPLVTVPGGLLGANGGLRVWLRYSSALNNANVKTCVLRIGATSVATLPALASGLSQRAAPEIKNRGSQAVQLVASGSSTHAVMSGTVSGVAWQQTTIDTSVDRVLGFGATVAVATDSIIIEDCTVELIGA